MTHSWMPMDYIKMSRCSISLRLVMTRTMVINQRRAGQEQLLMSKTFFLSIISQLKMRRKVSKSVKLAGMSQFIIYSI